MSHVLCLLDCCACHGAEQAPPARLLSPSAPLGRSAASKCYAVDASLHGCRSWSRTSATCAPSRCSTTRSTSPGAGGPTPQVRAPCTLCRMLKLPRSAAEHSEPRSIALHIPRPPLTARFPRHPPTHAPQALPGIAPWPPDATTRAALRSTCERLAWMSRQVCNQSCAMHCPCMRRWLPVGGYALSCWISERGSQHSMSGVSVRTWFLHPLRSEWLHGQL